MLTLSTTTLWACIWSEDQAMVDQIVRVLRYTARNIQFPRVVLFTHLAPPENWEFDAVQVPRLATQAQWDHFIVRWIPTHLKTDFSMCVHPDGFPIEFGLWKPEFLEYDWIGAPWEDGVVGNGGFYIESQQMLKLKPFLPFDNPAAPLASDYFVCRRYRKLLESVGIRFAPRALAMQFSTERVGGLFPSFGFHGRNDSPQKYAEGWKRIEESEKK